MIATYLIATFILSKAQEMTRFYLAFPNYWYIFVTEFQKSMHVTVILRESFACQIPLEYPISESIQDEQLLAIKP
jgi:hypothetical protein